MMIHPVPSPIERGSLLCRCNSCHSFFICTGFMRCPVCDGGDIRDVPIREHPCFTQAWLVNHGFILEDEIVVE